MAKKLKSHPSLLGASSPQLNNDVMEEPITQGTGEGLETHSGKISHRAGWHTSFSVEEMWQTGMAGNAGCS